MNDERFVPDMYNTADSVASVKGSASTRIIFNSAMIVTVLDILYVWVRVEEKHTKKWMNGTQNGEDNFN